jgi:dihydrofolate reductase
MRKIILDLAVTLDGFIEGPNGEVDWCIMDAEMDDYFRKFADEIDTVLYGRVSYERYGNYQPGPDRSGTEIDFYRAVNRMRKYVFSTTLQAVEGDATLVREDVAAQVQGLKREPGKDIWLFGGASLVTTFVRLDLIDEYRIGLHPVALGVGKPLFGALTGRLSLELVRSETYQSGLVGLWYRPRRG